jgi:hypothetical protein
MYKVTITSGNLSQKVDTRRQRVKRCSTCEVTNRVVYIKHKNQVEKFTRNCKGLCAVEWVR